MTVVNVPGVDASLWRGMLDHAARLRPSADAIVIPGDDGVSRLTYSRLGARVSRLVRVLPEFTGRPEAILIVAANDLELTEAVVGTLVAGHAVVPVSARMPAEAIAGIATRVGARIGLCTPTAEARRRELVAGSDSVVWVRPSTCGQRGPPPRRRTLEPGTALVCFTSGTTGRPKGVVLTHANLMIHLLTACATFRLRRHECHVTPLPLPHLAGLSRILIALATASTHVVMPEFSPTATVDAVERFRAEQLLLAPAAAVQLVETDTDLSPLSALRSIVYGTAPMPQPIAQHLVTRLGCGLFNGYGLTESCALVAALTPEEHRLALETDDEALLASVGLPVVGVDIRVVDEDSQDVEPGVPGQILVRGAKVSPGYLDDPERTASRFTSDGWLLTGDRGILDDDGRLRVLGRLDDLIISGGLNVAPEEVEEAVTADPEVAECAAFGVASERWGQEIHVAVVPRDGAPPDLDALRESLRSRLDRYKIPKQIHVVPRLPRTTVGKIQRAALARQYVDKEQR